MKLILIAFLLINCANLYSQDDSIRNTSISYYDYDIKITSNHNSFYTGRLQVLKNGKSEFSMDSVFSDYVEHNIIDMDGDGSKELLLTLSEGASPYVFNGMYIFDAKKGAKPRYYITNASLDTSASSLPAIGTFVRMSPSIMGFSYNWQMEYHNGKLRYRSPDGKTGAVFGPDYTELKASMKEIWPQKVDCDDYTYSVFFDYIFITSRISGEMTEAENFFNSEYKCPDKVSSLIRFKNTANETLNWIKDEKNYLFSEY